MKVLLLNQCFYPDVMATAQQLTDLAVGLTKEGHQVTVIASDRGYDDPSRRLPEERVTVLPPWAHDDTVRYDQQGRAAFRAQHKLDESFVVMYAGNHSPCHPLDTLMEAAKLLSDKVSTRKEIVFCFVGGGSEQVGVNSYSRRRWRPCCWSDLGISWRRQSEPKLKRNFNLAIEKRALRKEQARFSLMRSVHLAVAGRSPSGFSICR